MPLTPPESHCCKKRKRAAADESQPAQRRPHQRPKTRKSARPPTSFDNLSKIPFCPRTLREFDRRTDQFLYALKHSCREVPSSEQASLERFARLGGPNPDDIRGYRPLPDRDMAQRREPQSRESRSIQTTTSSRSRSRSGRTSAYDPLFEQQMVDSGIFPEGHHEQAELDEQAEPQNLEAIMEILSRPRESLSPTAFTKDDFRRYKKDNRDAKSEAGVMSTVFPIITGKSDTPSQQNISFGNLASLTSGTLTIPQPDLYDGCRPRDLKKTVRDELGLYIVPSTTSSNPVLPNFFGEVKGPGGNARVSKRQACHDGAVGARAVHELRTYIDPDTAADGNAYTVSSTYIGGSGGGTLTINVTHPVASKDPDRPWNYYMTEVNSYAMTGSIETFRQGATAFRNAREWAQEQRNALVAAANAKTSAHISLISLSAASESTADIHLEPDTSADELAGDNELHRVNSSRSSASRSRTSSTQRSRKPKRKRGEAVPE